MIAQPRAELVEADRVRAGGSPEKGTRRRPRARQRSISSTGPSRSPAPARFPSADKDRPTARWQTPRPARPRAPESLDHHLAAKGTARRRRQQEDQGQQARCGTWSRRARRKVPRPEQKGHNARVDHQHIDMRSAGEDGPPRDPANQQWRFRLLHNQPVKQPRNQAAWFQRLHALRRPDPGEDNRHRPRPDYRDEENKAGQ